VADLALWAGAAALASLTVVRNLDWQTPLSLWQDTVRKQPSSALAHGNLGLSCWTVGDRACAERELRTAAALDPLRADFQQALSEIQK
jgi:Flp pilus assembly protein TadD